MKQFSRQEIVEAVGIGLISCSGTFEASARPWEADRMPEFWILVSVMSELKRLGLQVLPEVRVNHDFMRCASEGSCWGDLVAPTPRNLKNAKFDLVAGVPASSGRLEVLTAIELKGPKANWNSLVGDVERLRALAPCFPSSRVSSQVRIFGYVPQPMSEDAFSGHAERFFNETALRRDDVLIASMDLSEGRVSRTFLYAT